MEYEKALSRLVRQCALCERCERDVRESMRRWEVDSSTSDKIVNYLVENKYVDNRRYTEAYIKDKATLSNWGEEKIVSGLRAKGIPMTLIKEYLEVIDPHQMSEKIEQAMAQKLSTITYKDKYDMRNKLLRFAFSRGYDMKIATKFLSRLGEYDD